MLNLLVVFFVGMIVILFGILVNSMKLFELILYYFIENSYEKVGGENMVNVIFVDFCGFDILFEIIVFCIVVFVIYGMICFWLIKEEEE